MADVAGRRARARRGGHGHADGRRQARARRVEELALRRLAHAALERELADRGRVASVRVLHNLRRRALVLLLLRLLLELHLLELVLHLLLLLLLLLQVMLLLLWLLLLLLL